MADNIETRWSAKHEILKVGAHAEQQFNEAVVVGPDASGRELVALAFGYSPEGVHRRALLVAAAPVLLASLKRAVSLYETYKLVSDDLECGLWINEARAALSLAEEKQ